MHDAGTNLSQLIADAEAGEEVIIMRGTTEAARLIPVREQRGRRQFGALAGKVSVTPAFFEPLPGEDIADPER